MILTALAWSSIRYVNIAILTCLSLEKELGKCRQGADVIVGPIGIVIADALWGEISPAMAAAVGQSEAKRILIPVNQCGNIVAGVSDLRVSALLASAVSEIRAIL